VAAVLEAAPPAPEGPAIDIGAGPGRGGWEIAVRTGRTVLSADLSLGFLRLAQRLALEGRAVFPRRRIGLVYDPAVALVPASHQGAPVDFWALDVQALPFPPGRFALAAAINVVDCVPNPSQVLAEAARVTMAGGAGVFTTPTTGPRRCPTWRSGSAAIRSAPTTAAPASRC
jgi:ubiquinone/menaquinone biosynthesis C-methylase UbiE